jgi:hypothetical protein
MRGVTVMGGANAIVEANNATSTQPPIDTIGTIGDTFLLVFAHVQKRRATSGLSSHSHSPTPLTLSRFTHCTPTPNLSPTSLGRPYLTPLHPPPTHKLYIDAISAPGAAPPTLLRTFKFPSHTASP